ncbi:MAG TPA: hypothetical protein VGF59_30095 [Bryobacteraceae bacterium]|jgi:hypothetical protein
MTLLRADSAKVQWDADKKRWLVRIQVGEEVIRRPLPKDAQDGNDEALRATAVQTAKDEGYEVAPETVAIDR